MPEKQKENYQKTLEDRAWQDMLGKLDTHMPVRVGLTGREKWLLALLIFITVGMGSYIAYLQLQENEEWGSPSQEEFIAGIPKTGVEDAKAYEGESSLAQDQSFSTDVKVSAKAAVPVQGNSHGVSSLFRGSEGKREEIRNVAFELLESEKWNGHMPSSIYMPEMPPERSNFITNSLPYEWSRVQSLAGTKQISIGVQRILAPRIDTWPAVCQQSFGFSLGWITENLVSFGGLESSLDYTYALNRKLALRTGLDFQMFNKNGFSNSLALSSIINAGSFNIINPPDEDWVEYRYSYDVNNSEIVNNEVGVEYITGIVDQLYYITIPVNLVYSFRDAHIFAGVNASVLLRGTNKVRDYSDQYFNTVVLSNQVLEKKNYLNRMDLGVQFGVEKRIWRNLYLYGKYNHGLLRIINSDSAKQSNASIRDHYETIYNKTLDQRIDFNRYFSLGLSWDINGCHND